MNIMKILTINQHSVRAQNCVLYAFKGQVQRECRERRFSFLLKIVKVKKLIF